MKLRFYLRVGEVSDRFGTGLGRFEQALCVFHAGVGQVCRALPKRLADLDYREGDRLAK